MFLSREPHDGFNLHPINSGIIERKENRNNGGAFIKKNNY
jgi:hypothetical protein